MCDTVIASMFFNVTNISVLSEVTLLTSTSSTIVIIFIVLFYSRLREQTNVEYGWWHIYCVEIS